MELIMSPQKLQDAAQIILPSAKQYDERASIQEMNFAVNYLTYFGYLLVKKLVENVTLEDVQAAIKKFQKWFNLKADGIVGAN